MTDDRAAAYLARLDAVQERLSALAHEPRDGLTPADASTGERWDQGQIWAHLAEFVPYWTDQLRRVVRTYEGTPVPFGRISTDPVRIAVIERDRRRGPASLQIQVADAVQALRGQLSAMTPTDWEVQGAHPTLRVMGVERMLEEFLVGHLEQHAAQIEAL